MRPIIPYFLKNHVAKRFRRRQIKDSINKILYLNWNAVSTRDSQNVFCFIDNSLNKLSDHQSNTQFATRVTVNQNIYEGET